MALVNLLIFNVFFLLISFVITKDWTVLNELLLKDALKRAKAGDTIRITRGGIYKGPFVLNSSGKKNAPIALVTADYATNLPVIFTCNKRKNEAIYIRNRKYWTISGIRFDGCRKGIIIENSTNIILDTIEVFNMKEIGIHFRKGSSDNTLLNSAIGFIGLNKFKGSWMGVIIGSDMAYWANGIPDKCDRIQLTDNTFEAIKGVAIEIKEGTCCSTFSGNKFAGESMRGLKGGSCWMRIKGNTNLLEKNEGTFSVADGYVVETSKAARYGGCNNTFHENKCTTISSSGFCIRLTNQMKCKNQVYNDNEVTDESGELSNVDPIGT